jgi:hypothetical protein
LADLLTQNQTPERAAAAAEGKTKTGAKEIRAGCCTRGRRATGTVQNEDKVLVTESMSTYPKWKRKINTQTQPRETKTSEPRSDRNQLSEELRTQIRLG